MTREYIPGQEIKEMMPQKEIAFAFVKPDFIKDLPEIEKILKESGLVIIYEDKIKMSPQAIDYIYAASQKEHFYPAMRKYLADHEVVVLVVGGNGLDAQKVLSSLKKDGNTDGIIRQKLQQEPKVPEKDLDLWQRGEHPEQDALSVVLTQKNVIHTSDSTADALRDLKIILGDKFEYLQKTGNLPAELWDIFNQANE